MTEQTPKSRTVEQIQSEYTKLCAKAGHLQYSIFSLQADLNAVNSTLRELNLEAAASAAANQGQPAEKENK